MRARASGLGERAVEQVGLLEQPSRTVVSEASTARLASTIASRGNDAMRRASATTNGRSSAAGSARLIQP